MRPFSFLLSVLLLTLVPTSMEAQKNKVAPALSEFLQTEFMTRFMDMKIEAESAVKTFQSQQHQYRPAEVSQLRTAYEKMAVRFNAVLEGIKQDFLDGQKLKYIEKYPEDYNASLELKLYKLSEEYQRMFQQPLADITAGNQDGMALLFLVTEVIGLSKGLSDYFGKLRRESRIYSQNFLEQTLVGPYRWQSWDQLASNYIQRPNFQTNLLDPSNIPLNLPTSGTYQNTLNNNTQWNNTDTWNDDQQWNNADDTWNDDQQWNNADDTDQSWNNWDAEQDTAAFRDGVTPTDTLKTDPFLFPSTQPLKVKAKTATKPTTNTREYKSKKAGSPKPEKQGGQQK